MRVAAEGADLGAHPAQRRLLVGQAEGAGAGKPAVREEAEGTEAVVDGDDDHVAADGHAMRVV